MTVARNTLGLGVLVLALAWPVLGADLNFNGLTDVDDIASGYSADINGNQIPDECEGLAGNLSRIFVPAGSGHGVNELFVGEPEEIIFAIAITQSIVDVLMPFRFSSNDGSPMWDVIAEDDGSAVYGPYSRPEFSRNSQDGAWPDSLSLYQWSFSAGYGALLPENQFYALWYVTVTPTKVGTATIEVAPFAAAYLPAVVYTDNGNVEIPFETTQITILPSRCTGQVGDVNLQGGDRPTISDISMLIDHLFGTGVELACLREADVNQSGGEFPQDKDITIGDITKLIGFLFNETGPLPDCN
jgi:hypothetical protein